MIETAPLLRPSLSQPTLFEVAELKARIGRLEAENARLHNLLVTDELTGLANRRGFKHAVMAEQDRLNRHLSPGGLLMMIDLDRFKGINDSLGHAAGDLALFTVGEILRSRIRTMDTAARLGGDEFAVLLAGVVPERALARAQQISRDLNRATFTWGEETVSIGASVGIRALKIDDCYEELMASTDALMYQDKMRLGDGLRDNV
jgi:diguanylate cyclase (GGDEF)-like protein